jgi:hypothetical protein
VENKHLLINGLFRFSTCPPGFHIFLIPQKTGVWEGVLAGESYPRLSPAVFPCAGAGFPKKTSTPFIPAAAGRFPQVIPEIIPTAKLVWKTPWKTGGISPKNGLINWK